jgi:hypothetical protein
VPRCGWRGTTNFFICSPYLVSFPCYFDPKKLIA